MRESRTMLKSTLAAAAALLTMAAPAVAQNGAPAVAAPPTLGPAPQLTLPAVQRTTLPNGLTLQVVEMHEVPLVQATLLVDGGGRLDADRPGLASFTAGMLDEGAAGRDAFAFAAALDQLGASLSTGANWDATAVSLRAPRRTFAQAMDLLADAVLRPTFASASVARQRELRLADILQRRDQPYSLADLAFLSAVFPEGHPYHEPLGGDSASTAALDSAMVRNFWERSANPSRATLIVTGDITLAQAKQIAQQELGEWSSLARPLVTPPASTLPAVMRPATRVILVNKPGAPQSVIQIGAPGVQRGSEDYAALTLMNTILGGSFSSRLNQILREQRGYTYGASSRFQWEPIPGPFIAASAVRTDATDSSLVVFFREMKRIRSEPVSPAELARAKSYVVLGSLGDFETTRQVAAQLAQLDAFGLPLSVIPKELAKVQTLTAADVQRVAQKYIDPDHLTVVVVGDLAKIRPGIEKLGLGPITVVEPAGGTAVH